MARNTLNQQNQGQDTQCCLCGFQGNTAHDLTWSERANGWVCYRCYPPCPACGQPHDPTYIPPPRVPLGISCACCCPAHECEVS